MSAPKRQKTTSEDQYQYIACTSWKVSSKFPDTTPTNECPHNIRTCTWCLKKYIAAQIEAQVARIACPECDKIMQEEKIHAHAFSKDVKPYDVGKTAAGISEKAVKKLTKACPHCKTRIQKNGGCDAMFCKKCRKGFSWSAASK